MLEVIAFDIASCAIIARTGANRIELCANPLEGGTTVSYGMLKAARAAVTIDIFPIIRPRGGDFLYTDEEYAIMEEDVKACKQLGMDGVVIGGLQPDGTVNRGRIAKLVEIAYPLDVTFHRAFDRVRDPFEALEAVIDCGCTRILTSGLRDNAIAGAATLAALVKAADDRIIIMPGAGIRSGNIASLKEATNATEFHTSARKLVSSAMDFHQGGLSESTDAVTVDGEEIRKCLEALQSITAG